MSSKNSTFVKVVVWVIVATMVLAVVATLLPS